MLPIIVILSVICSLLWIGASLVTGYHVWEVLQEKRSYWWHPLATGIAALLWPLVFVWCLIDILLLWLGWKSL
jgi:hypothetical protein